jgi:hypothetical protein
MKVCIVTPFADPEKGACVVRVNSFKEFFESRNVEVTVVAPKRKGIAGKNRYFSIKELFFRILKGKFDFVIGTSPPLPHNFFALLATKFSNAKFVLDAKDDGYFFENSKKEKKSLNFKIYSFLRTLTYKFSDLSIYLTKEDLLLEKKRYDLKEQLLIPNGGVQEVSFDSKSRARIRKKAEFEKKDCVGCYLGSIGDEDIGGLLKNSEGNKFLFVVSVSNDEFGKKERKLLKDLVKQYSPKSKIFENIPLSEVGKHISAADYGILPWNNFMPTSIPVKLFDYVSVGLPVITKGYKNTAIERFHKENDIGFFTTSWNDFFKKVKIVKRKKINKNLKKQFLRENFISKLWVDLEKRTWIK